MSQGTAVEERRRQSARTCKHRWIIETPHGATSRGVCKRCGTTKRFPNAAEDALWESGAGLGRWSNQRGLTRVTRIHPRDEADSEVL
jgi:hypothetical protein